MSCSNPNKEWYEENSCEDLNLIPLIKPYRLFTVGSGNDRLGWFITFMNNGKVDECGNNLNSQMNVKRVSVKGDIIYGYCEDYSEYFVIKPKEKIEKMFDNKSDWVLYLKTINQDTCTLYDPDGLYTLYNEGSTARHGSAHGHYRALPWYNDIKSKIE